MTHVLSFPLAVGLGDTPGRVFVTGSMAPTQWLVEIINFPLETELMRRARENGQRVANHVSMVVRQAAEAFHMFTGHAPYREQMLERLLDHIDSERFSNGKTA